MADNEDDAKHTWIDEAEVRTVLAAERTLAAWIRTSLSAIGGGLIVAKLPEGILHTETATVAGVVLNVMGVLMALVALHHHVWLRRSMRHVHMRWASYWVAWPMLAGLMLVGLLAIVMIFR